MKWVDLCSIPDKKNDCIQILKWYILQGLLGKEINSVEELEVIPKNNFSTDWIFFKDGKDEYHFCELPSTLAPTICSPLKKTMVCPSV